MRFQANIWFGFALLVIGCGLGFSENIPDESDRYCGPRAVHFVMRFFSLKCSLESLIDQLQPNSSELPSMLDLKRNLLSVGLHAIAIRMPATSRPINSLPVIIHLPQQNATGHFSVIVPNSYDPVSNTYEIFHTDRLSRRVTIGDLRMSRELLFVSKDTVEDPTSLLINDGQGTDGWAAMGVGVVALICFRLWKSHDWSKKK